MHRLARFTGYLRMPHYVYVVSPLLNGNTYSDLHIVFLTRALLKSRTGFQKSDGVVRYLVSRVVQIGFFATLWTLGGLATWFLMPRYDIYALFVMTSGTIYTHVGGSFS
jgi:hypothetical protein